MVSRVRASYTGRGAISQQALRGLVFALGLVASVELVDKKTGQARTVEVGALFSFKPILLETSSPGVFAAGDVRSGSVKRVASAVGEGAMAVQFVHEHLKTL